VSTRGQERSAPPQGLRPSPESATRARPGGVTTREDTVKNDPAKEIKKTLDKTDRDINRAGVSGDKVLDNLKKMFDERTRDKR